MSLLTATIFIVANTLVGAEPEVNPAALPPKPAPSAALATRPRLVSPELASRLAEAAPKYVSPSAPPAQSTAAVDARETDKPRNTIIRLPRYVVQESKLPDIAERELLTPKGKLELAYKLYPGLRTGAIGSRNNDFWAKEMLADDFFLQRKQEWADLSTLLPADTPIPVFTRQRWKEGTAGFGPWAGLLVPWERR
jgi:hypothetical protein